jgi:hypothetical protein
MYHRKWNVQVRLLSPKLSKVSSVIQFLMEGMNPHIIRGIYYANFHGLLRYGTIFWSGDNKSNSIFKLQKKG